MIAEEILQNNLSHIEQFLIEESETLPQRLIDSMEQYANEKLKRVIYDNDLMIKLRHTNSNSESRRLIKEKFNSL